MKPVNTPGAVRPTGKRQYGGTMSIIRILMTALMLAVFALPVASHQADPAEEASTETTADKPAEAAAKPRKTKIPKEIIFESPTGDVMFPHRAHMKQKCATCHHQIRAKAIHSPHEDYLQSTWIDCHKCHKDDPETDNVYYTCNNCHHAHPESIRDETHSPKVVVHKSCWKCHSEGTGAEASARCSYCHGNMESTSADADNMK